jgi:ribosomal protein L11 methyltransferase
MSANSWLQLTLTTTRDAVGLVSETLENLSALTVTWQDAEDTPIYEPKLEETPLWPKVRITSLFSHQQNPKQLIKQLQQNLSANSVQNIAWKFIADQDWQQNVEQSFTPIQINPQLWICPQWQQPANKEATNILLNPGLAFGTGEHPTTKLCLEWLSQQVRPGMSCIDYGCGSGILAITAAVLGATSVYAVDIDPQALQATQQNCQLNAIPTQQLATCLPDKLPNIQVDILVANILANPLCELAAHFSQLVKPGGKIALTGILTEQISNVQQHYTKHFSLEDNHTDAEWALLHGVKI